ncbi:Heterokaryon incompatibility protein 6, OR allele [Pseudocercospora fuligena]|uniref:Heterokaryon incompatibility protein 6, OR allele n=1 Tax=Pseudocercospora fuligena TaxID=685502 RepID=A0A8H6RRS7_9PEZI|nr:Heterokaryon incompatibility protein 6, OR allele [Pseudocercospora fuligena]
MFVADITAVSGNYTAVSYVWGTSAPSHEIEINGCRLGVRYNCWYALRQIKWRRQRDARVKRWCWIDALCIDQEYHGEKNSQVSQMGLIFSQAYEVAACMGEHLDTIMSPKSLDLQVASRQNRKPYDSQQLPYAEAFLRRPYFERIWTTQECILARRLKVFIGTYCWPWSDLMSALGTRHDSERASETALGTCSAVVQELRLLDRDIAYYSQPELQVLVSKYGRRYCLDPRDKIYGILPLAAPIYKQEMRIDYDKTLCEILIDYMRVCTISMDTFANAISDAMRDPHTGSPEASSERSLKILVEAFSSSTDFHEDLALFMSGTHQSFSLFTFDSGADEKPIPIQIYQISTAYGDQFSLPDLDLCLQLKAKGYRFDRGNNHTPKEVNQKLQWKCLQVRAPQSKLGNIELLVPSSTQNGDFLVLAQRHKSVCLGDDIAMVCRQTPDPSDLGPRQLRLVGFARSPTSSLSMEGMPDSWLAASLCALELLDKDTILLTLLHHYRFPCVTTVYDPHPLWKDTYIKSYLTLGDTLESLFETDAEIDEPPSFDSSEAASQSPHHHKRGKYAMVKRAWRGVTH